jgi:FkbM family methyltransferase
MTFISYAQNFEDVMLWRALKEIKNGFYVDVGAAWPDEHSVTKAFYESGWHGINIEPNPEHYSALLKKRPLDLNLQLAVGDLEGTVVMNFVGSTGLSTAVEKFAEQHKSAGWTSKQQEIPIATLKAIFRENLQPKQPIHFLKVDVEGLEEAVLRGNDWKNFRPWVVVVEATLPLTQTESFDEWEPILLNAGYIFAYADGLNRFYVANENCEYLRSFKYPPNVFDNFLLSSQVKVENEFQQAEAKAEQAEVKAEQAEVKAEQAEVKAEQAEVKAELAEVKVEQAEAKVEQAEAKVEQAEAKAEQAEAKAEQAEAKAEQAEAKAEQAEAVSNQLHEQIKAICASRSWRYTAYFRKVISFLSFHRK